MLRIIEISVNQTSIYNELPYAEPTAVGRHDDQVVRAFDFLLDVLASFIIVTTILLLNVESISVLLLHLIFVVKELHQEVSPLSHLSNMISQLTPISFGSSRYLSFC